MGWITVVGYAAAVIGAFYALPQTWRILRVNSAAGLSVLTWQLQVGVSTGWTVHGFVTAQPNVWGSNLLILACAVVTLVMIRREQQLSHAVWGLALIVGGVLLAVDLLWGAVLFGAMIIVPLIISMMIQFRALWVAPDFSGYSWFYNAFAAFTQLPWLVYAIPNKERAIEIGATATLTLQLACLTLYLVKRHGVRLPGVHDAVGVTGVHDAVGVAGVPDVVGVSSKANPVVDVPVPGTETPGSTGR